ncbi:MAG: hypothetical protein AAF519_02640 [Bacteroidota bacterium]
MKAIYFSLYLLGCALHVSAQTIKIVDNTGRLSGDHVFPTFGEAFDAASPGDTIQVVPSNDPYGNLDISGKDDITVFGIGFNPVTGGQSERVLFENGIISGANNITVSGIVVTRNFNIQGNSTPELANNIRLDNCFIGQFFTIGANSGTGTGMLRNVVINNCIVERETTVNSRTDAVIFNNSVFSGVSLTTVQVDNGANAVFNHCLFLGISTSDLSSNLNNTIIQNSIFYGVEPRIGSSLFSDNRLESNIIAGAADPTVVGFDVDINNVIVEQSDLFADDSFVLSAQYDLTVDPTPSSSLALGQATDGTDIGLTGGLGFSRTGTILPIISNLSVPGTVRTGEQLEITIEATGN